MALEALTSNELFNFIIYDTISATPTETSFVIDNNTPKLSQDHQQNGGLMDVYSSLSSGRKRQQEAAVQGRKKRRRKPKVCKNKEEAENQRMTHIAVERNRRKMMNEHLSVLRSLMPESYVQRGDQASIVGGAIDFVKELEHLLQSLEAKKLQLFQPEIGASSDHEDNNVTNSKILPTPFAQFFVHPQYTCCSSQICNKYTSKTKAAIADIEVTLIETHANLRILSRRSPKQLSKLVAGFHSLHLTILHLNVTSMNPLVLYSISVKVEEACPLTTVDNIAAAVHHMLGIIEDEAASLCS
ncbi:hypothetical protein UlMin_001155 [Ulmus minor]